MRLFPLLTLLSLFFANCITTYRDYPVGEHLSASREISKEKFYYHIAAFPILEFGGYASLKSFFKSKITKNFNGVEEILDPNEMPEKGIYCKVNTKWVPLSAPSFIFGYLSVATATILPAWSSRDGYDVTFTLFKNGQKIRDFNYSSRRFVFLWIFTLPVVWVNLFTSSEEEVFQAIANQFMYDVQPYLNK